MGQTTVFSGPERRRHWSDEQRLQILTEAFAPGAWGRINISLIREHWPDLIRLAGSLKLGHLKAAGVMRMLKVKDLPTTLAKALSELGRIIKTLHILRYIDDRPFRRRILFQLNRQELRHKLGRRVYHGDRGEIAKPAAPRAGRAAWRPWTRPQLHRALEHRLHAGNRAPAQPARRRCPPISPASRRLPGVTSTSSGATTSPCPTPS
jgi:hypothetical protein